MNRIPQADPLTLHYDTLIFDAHCDTLGDVLAGTRHLGERSDQGHSDLPRMREAGVSGQVFACFVPQPHQQHGATRHALQRLDTFYQEMEANPDALLLATSAADIEEAKRAGKVAGVLGLEGAEALDGSLEVLRCFYRLGVRVLGLAWDYRNAACDGVKVGGQPGGLTAFGEQVVKECNRLGIVVDVSHLAGPGLGDVLALSEQPVIASHSNARALCDHMRNLSDAQLEAIAANGGVVCVTFVPWFIRDPWPGASLDDFLKHIDHLIAVMGIDHVGLGSDFDGYEQGNLAGMEDVTRLPALTAGLLARGYEPMAVRKILGGNLLRVFRQVVG
ncbi:MAG: dipeptidase [Anaerolineae bacterium]|nr:dipeptidase [Anaerolineae bacterium]